LKERGFEICIIEDANIAPAIIDSFPRLRTAVPNVLVRREFNEIFLPETGLIDAWTKRHGENAKGYTWYLRVKEGTDYARIDLMQSNFITVQGKLRLRNGLDRNVEVITR
jgi:hypothetical protein